MSKPRSKIRIWLIAIGVLLALGCGVFGIFLVMVGFVGHIQITWILVTGWFSFPFRTLPRVTWNGSMVGMGVLCAVGVIVLTQWLLRETTRNLRFTPWRWRWTICGLAGIGVLFLVGLSIGGAAHQIGWIMGSGEPWFREMSNVRHSPMALEHTASRGFGAGWTRPAQWKSEMLEIESGYLDQKDVEGAHILFILDDKEMVTGIIIAPREGKSRGYNYGTFIDKTGERSLNETAIRKLIREHSAHIEAF